MIQIDDVRDIQKDEIPDDFLSEMMFDQSPAGDVLRQRFERWLVVEGVYYYARPRESFSLNEARKLAAEANCHILWTEDLS